MSTHWLEELFKFDNEQSVSRAVLSSHFELIRPFCQSSNKTISDARVSYYGNEFISVRLLSETQFIDQNIAFITEFQTKTISSFRRYIALIVDTTLGEQLMFMWLIKSNILC